MSASEDVDAPAESRVRRLDIPKSGPLDGAGQPGGARTAREARAHLRIAVGPARLCAEPAPYPLPEGPVPREELDRLRRLYRTAPGYAAMRGHLRRTGLLALCGEPGTGRAWTGLALLAELSELAGGGVSRLGSGIPHGLGLPHLSGLPLGPGIPYGPGIPHGSGAPHESGLPFGPGIPHGSGIPHGAFGVEKTERGHGYLLELPADQPDFAVEPLLDRLRAHFAGHEAFCVVLVAGGPAADRLLRARRHAVPYEPPAAADVLDRHLSELLADRPTGLLETARATARRPELAEALGLDGPRPGEAARLAGLLAAHAEGRLSEERLLEHCRSFAPDQARAWFVDAGRSGILPAALPALRAAALRIALAVFNGSAHSLMAEAAELLAWELAVTLDPQYAPGRPLFAARPGASLATARAVHGDGVEDLGDASVPVRAVWFEGRRLALAVLHESWDAHHNLRGPMARWLRGLCDDPRPQVWVRAAVAAGVLCARDYLYGLVELALPLARTDSPVQRMAAATALAEASRAPEVRPAVNGLLRDWARGDDERERETAALAHGYGLAAGSIVASLEELGRIACADDGRTTSCSVLRLLAGTEPETVLTALTRWLRDTRRPRRDLALLTVLRAVTTRTSHLWGLCEVPELEPYAAWPLATAVLAAHPGCAPRLAELLRAALTWARSAGAAEDALVGWIRRAAGDERQLTVLCGFLPRLAQDGDEPLDAAAATRIREVLEAL
ncbi:hypothetical protein [Streptomyces violaceusniger]|uniref:Uncharacterized protein n=1 Tax=Streptomyces violaceusniger (strain Tu 4113) TaxID=653045 RepID=G2P2I7_STRV4|nr:hypothetical protein [Streptomyces violaceusniger]AEM81959.1 hypothetical protein Strvi_2232 [Streptomyces violaceusniger Tu 4113]